MAKVIGSSGRVAFTVRLMEEQHRALRVFVAERGMDLQDASELAFRRLLSDTVQDQLSTVSGEEREATLLWLEFYRGSGREARALVLDALKAWRERMS